MSERELGCANCGEAGHLEEGVTVEATTTRRVRVYATGARTIDVRPGNPSSFDVDFGVELDTGEIWCSKCGERFDSWEEAVDGKVCEYCCATCGWWGLQEWLHQDCDGELEELKAPIVAAQPLSLGVRA